MSSNAKTLVGALGALAVAVIAVLTTFGVVDWSDAQTALVTTEAAALIGLIGAVVAHRTPGTKQEPVAVAAAFTAALSATIALGTGFEWWNLTTEQTSVLVSLVTAIIGVGSALFARTKVTAATTAAG